MDTNKNNLKEVIFLFFKLGCIAFGGPAAHVAMMEEEVVNKRKWMSRQHFLDLMGATNLIPGPNSTEMTMHCGHERAGIPGLFAAGISFIFPAVVITGVLAWAYTEYGQLPEVQPFIYGIKPAVLAIIAGAIFKLGKKALKNTELGILGALVLIASVLGVNEILALLGAGLIGAIYFYVRQGNTTNSLLPLTFILGSDPLADDKLINTSKIFWSFLKVGSILYGSGYVLFAYLDAELVMNGLLSRQELIDAVAVGQFTPGPVLSTATFIGYQMGGVKGAMAATAGIFLPSFLFVWILNPLIPKMRKSLFLRGFLDSVNIAAVAVMCSVLISMAQDTLTNWQSIVLAILGLVFTFGPKKLSAMWIVLGSSILGYLLMLI
ncbi:chromate efflux transporter [Marinigracilibium pacificum]|uniref:Chromate efflux transporter n=1 Tax=Marinigracilibium pacificum TaxID=2729599 RepID=A0A848IUC1_9BACT|nr:chromate efflux transporter [Marinigracilibium pacificum]NMM47316.1 chromate efflux transporter [Marinigracilibium pacificum]